MKLKKTSTTSTIVSTQTGAAIAERFRLDGDPRAAKGGREPSSAAVTTTLVFGLVALAVMAIITVMMYNTWTVIGPQ